MVGLVPPDERGGPTAEELANARAAVCRLGEFFSPHAPNVQMVYCGMGPEAVEAETEGECPDVSSEPPETESGPPGPNVKTAAAMLRDLADRVERQIVEVCEHTQRLEKLVVEKQRELKELLARSARVDGAWADEQARGEELLGRARVAERAREGLEKRLQVVIDQRDQYVRELAKGLNQRDMALKAADQAAEAFAERLATVEALSERRRQLIDQDTRRVLQVDTLEKQKQILINQRDSALERADKYLGVRRDLRSKLDSAYDARDSLSENVAAVGKTLEAKCEELERAQAELGRLLPVVGVLHDARQYVADHGCPEVGCALEDGYGQHSDICLLGDALIAFERYQKLTPKTPEDLDSSCGE